MVRPADKLPIPPGRLPIIGHAIPMIRKPGKFLRSLNALGPIVRLQFGPLPVYFLTDPSLVHQILVTHGRFFDKGRFFDRARPMIGNGLVTSNGAFNRLQHRLMQPAFHRARIAEYAKIMAHHADALAQSLRPGQVIEIGEVMTKLMMTMVVKVMFSAEAHQTSIDQARRSLRIVADGLPIRIMMPKAIERLPVPFNRRFDNACKHIREIIDPIVAAYRKEDIDRSDLLSMLFAARDEEEAAEGMSDLQIRDELVTILTGGIQTTKSTLSFLFLELSRHPNIETRIREEIDRVVGNDSITFENVHKLQYLNRVLNEVVRMYPAFLFMRRPTKPVNLGGIDIPAQAEVAYSPYALHHDPRAHAEPDLFDPDRWLPERSKIIPKGSFIPFGLGNRKCIGDLFAWTEMMIVAATVVSRWSLCPVAGYENPRVRPAAFPHPGVLPMVVAARS